MIDPDQRKFTMPSIFEKTVVGLFAVSIGAVAVSWVENRDHLVGDANATVQASGKHLVTSTTLTKPIPNNHLIDDAHAAVRDSLKDPASANFRNELAIGAGGSQKVCGEVNAKNSVGGYVGFRPFVYYEQSKSVYVANENSSWFVFRLCAAEKDLKPQDRLYYLKAWLEEYTRAHMIRTAPAEVRAHLRPLPDDNIPMATPETRYLQMATSEAEKEIGLNNR